MTTQPKTYKRSRDVSDFDGSYSCRRYQELRRLESEALGKIKSKVWPHVRDTVCRKLSALAITNQDLNAAFRRLEGELTIEELLVVINHGRTHALTERQLQALIASIAMAFADTVLEYCSPAVPDSVREMLVDVNTYRN